MDKNIELQEVKELQSRFQASATELNQQFESLLGKIADFSEINSFQGAAADGIKGHLSRVHGSVISGCMVAAESLSMQFEKALEDFNSSVDSDADTKIYGSYLDNVKQKINGYSNSFNQSNELAQQTISSINDIVPIHYPSSSGISEGVEKSQKEISDTLEKLETYNSQQNDLQNFDDMLRGLDGAMRQIQETEGNFSSDTTEKLLSEGTFASIVGVAKKIAGYTGKVKKGVVGLFSGYLRLVYMKKNLGFGVDFDVDARKGKGAYVFKTLNDADIVAASKLLASDANEDAIFKFIFKDKFKVNYNNETRNVIKQAKKDIYKLPEFKAVEDFMMTRNAGGFLKAFKNRWTDSFGTEFQKSIDEFNFKKWPETFKKLKGTGTLFKSVAIIGTGLTVVDNIIQSQDDGFQLQDVRDVALDTGVDLAYAAGAAATGAAIGTAVGPLGTLAGGAIGAVVGIGASLLVNEKLSILGGESVVSGTKKLVKWAVNMNDNLKSGNYKEFTKENEKVLKKLKSIFW
ncbi:hypothetical protein COK25_29880 [Bacillus cereus]|uniref:LXG domain-containing protein n=1 Tax=Bacillus thuringiensis TaxID=1428 RepID=A0A9X6KI26_BACTU|nr:MULTISPECIES: T7SS effector LXG polymorphic toxin [Bacillus cereus group]MDA2613181.1 T7SS effector LXG polymorphic toxin [Bacillus cereus]MEB8554616.1 T7SS effector LXG polymorphic toxin [Bacillus cereus]MEB8647853.1 T7SS effector LXG polymorphic toxin [Bacillus cereus]MEB8667396.1 T7SS effector LXG polymorphic toxin [Bacillus cereus]MEB8727698.1 T7SS effector LXG polymorphic toxin [Bacillus cereus]